MENLFNGDYKSIYLKAKARKICIVCQEPADYFRDESSRLEYSVSAICQRCQDNLFER
jgi:superfamily II helicase